MNSRIKDFADARFGIFFHWGLYSVLGGIYKGEKMTEIGEWAQSYFRIPNEEYSALAKDFNPYLFNADKWADRMAKAGAKYVIFTAKHHEGFCMFKTEYNRYNIVDATPFGRDIVGELSEACRRHGLKFGLYYSHALDWSERDAGRASAGSRKNCNVMSWNNDWDFPGDEGHDFDLYYERKAMFQIRELLTNYGPIASLWFDTPFEITPERAERMYNLVKSLQPDCLVNSRIGGGFGDYGSLGDNQVLSSKVDYLAESPVTLNNTWGYKSFDNNWKTSAEIISRLLSCTETRSNILLNIGPRPDGEWTPETILVLEELAGWNKKNGGMLYASEGNRFPQPLDCAYASFKDKRLYLYPKTDLRSFTIDGIQSKVVSANVKYIQNGSSITIEAEEGEAAVLNFDERPHITEGLFPQNGTLHLLSGTARLIQGTEEVNSTDGELNVDGTLLDSGTHLFISGAGGITQWHNPCDRIEWDTIILSEGTYTICVKTVQSWWSAPWIGERRIKITVNGTEIENNLEISEALPPSCYNGAWSAIGVVTLPAGNHTVALSTISITDEKAMQMELAEVKLVSQTVESARI